MAFTFQRDNFDPKYMALAKFFSDMSARRDADQSARDKFEMQKQLLDHQAKLEQGKVTDERGYAEKTNEELANAIRLMFPENRPDMPTESELPVTGLADLSGMPGVAGQSSPKDGVNRTLGPKATRVPTQAPGPSMPGDIGETRKMSSEEIIPELIARLTKAGAKPEDIQRLHSMMIPRNDLNVAYGKGLGGESDPSPFQTREGENSEADLNYKNAQTMNLLASADSKQNPAQGDDVSAWAERLANGEITLDQIPRFPQELRSSVNKYMKDQNLAIIAPKVREQVAGVHKTNKMLDLFEEKWARVEDEASKGNYGKAALAYKDYQAAVKGNSAQFRKAVGESGQFTEADATRMIDLMDIGWAEASADLINSKSNKDGMFAGRMRKRLNDTRESFTQGLDAQVRNYYGKLGEDGRGMVELSGIDTKRDGDVRGGNESNAAAAPKGGRPSLDDLWKGNG